MDTLKKIDTNLCEAALQAEFEEMKKCPHCGKSFVWYDKKLPNINVHVQVPNCNCFEQIQQKEEAAKIAAAKKERLKKLFENSLMTEFFKQKVFTNLEKTEHFTVCKKYADSFDPKTSDGIQMIGNVGTGKTTLLAAICNELMERNFSCLFTTLSALLDKFSKYSYENAGDIAPLLNWLNEFDFVVLDDIGRENYTDKRKEIAFRIIDSLLNNKTVTAFTANPEMLDRLKSIYEWNAALDRLKDMCAIKLQFTGCSLRGQKC